MRRLPEFALLGASRRTSIAYDEAAEIVGYRPGVVELNSYLERFGFTYCGDWVWRKSAAITQRTGRNPTDKERLETTGRPGHSIERHSVKKRSKIWG
jgi:DNA modification methylase